ncbi:MAG: ester cyclase [Chloroflexi bacterium]|nr:ester cyclase [Chloroflexota bacterium]
MVDTAALARAIYDDFNRTNFEPTLVHVADDAEAVVDGLGMVLHGKEGVRQMMAFWKAPFPDGRVEVVGQVATADAVANECLFHATHTQPMEAPGLPSIPATGRTVTLTFVEIWRFRGDKLISLHNYADRATLLRQIGAI